MVVTAFFSFFVLHPIFRYKFSFLRRVKPTRVVPQRGAFVIVVSVLLVSPGWVLQCPTHFGSTVSGF